VRERVLRADPGRFDAGDFAAEPSARVRALLNGLRRRPIDTAAGILAVGAVAVIMINALFLQSGPHPAPIFANRPPPAAAGPAVVLPKARPADGKGDALVSAKPRADVVAEIQRELIRRGFYDGAPDGLYGPKTDSAVRDFEQAAGLRPSSEPNDALLQAISRSSIKAKPVAAAAGRNDPIAGLLGPDRRVLAVQRALADFGYGQIKPTGVYDPETRAAIERFERERKLPVTGQVSERLTRELTVMTGRPLE
jgi:peptidoglycan hydrolase-like protein with peptidoglycan-binding domain